MKRKVSKIFFGETRKKLFLNPDIISILILTLAVLLFFSDVIFSRSKTLIWDSADYYFPYLYYISSVYRDGQIPLWNPFLFNGYPSFANMQSQAFYPINFLFLPFSIFKPYVVHLALIFHFLLSGCFMYFLGKNYFDSRLVCIFSSVIYMLSGFMIGHIEHLTMIEAITWFPLVFLFFEKALTKNSIFYASLAGLFLGVTILAGFPQATAYIFYCLLFHAIYRLTTIYFKDEKRNNQILLRGVLLTIFIFSISLLLSSIQIIPTIELARNSTRSGALSLQFSSQSGQFSLKDAIVLLIPNYFGAVTGPFWGDTDVSQNLVYLGVFPIVLVGLSFLNHKKTEITYLFSMMLLYLMICLGKNGYIYFLYFHLPGIDHFRSPIHLAFLYTFFAAVLAGYGLESFLKYQKKSVIYRYLALFFLGSLVIYFLSPAPPTQNPIFNTENMKHGLVIFIFFYSLLFLFTILLARTPSLRQFYTVLILVFMLLDLHFVLGDAYHGGERISPETLEKETVFITAIKDHSGVNLADRSGFHYHEDELEKGLFRVYTRDLVESRLVGHNRAMFHRIFLANGYEPLILNRHHNFEAYLLDRNMDNLLKIQNVKYFFKLDPTTMTLNVFEYPGFLPRAFLAKKATFIKDDNKVLETLSSSSFDPSSEVIISGDGIDTNKYNFKVYDTPNDGSSVKIQEFSPNKIKIRTDSENNNFLVLSDTFYPGWQVWVDDKEQEILRANYDFKAVYLPQGKHLVTFEFNPDSFKVGLFLSLVSLLVIFLIIFSELILKKFKKLHRDVVVASRPDEGKR